MIKVLNTPHIKKKLKQIWSIISENELNSGII